MQWCHMHSWNGIKVSTVILTIKKLKSNTKFKFNLNFPVHSTLQVLLLLLLPPVIIFILQIACKQTTQCINSRFLILKTLNEIVEVNSIFKIILHASYLDLYHYSYKQSLCIHSWTCHLLSYLARIWYAFKFKDLKHFFLSCLFHKFSQVL